MIKIKFLGRFFLIFNLCFFLIYLLIVIFYVYIMILLSRVLWYDINGQVIKMLLSFV